MPNHFRLVVETPQSNLAERVIKLEQVNAQDCDWHHGEELRESAEGKAREPQLLQNERN